MWLYRTPLVVIAAGLVRWRPEPRRFVLNLLFGFVPAGLVGLIFHRAIKAYLFSPLTVASSLVLGGIAIWAIEASRPKGLISEIDDVRPTLALGIGGAQCLSLIPGVSRAAATILGGMLLGLDRQTATIFSFYLAMPTMLAASLFELLKIWSTLTAADLGLFSTGFVVAFVSAVASVRFLLRYIAVHDFKAFAYYRIVFGAAALAYFLTLAG